MKEITTIVVNYNTEALIPRLIHSLNVGSVGLRNNVIVIDNASSDDSLRVITQQFPQLRLIKNSKNVGFGRANNQVLSLVTGDFVLLLNTDAFMSPESLKDSISYMEQHPDCGILGAKLVGKDGVLQPSCRYFPTPTNIFLARVGLSRIFPWVRLVDDMAWSHSEPRECDWVPGCYYLVRRQVIADVGLFDPRFFLYYEEVDHCRRAKYSGWKVVFYPGATVTHYGGESAKSDGQITNTGRQLAPLQVESEVLYVRKHYGRIGVIYHLFLVLIGDLILELKLRIKNQSVPVKWSTSRFSQYWEAYRNTGYANQPTR